MQAEPLRCKRFPSVGFLDEIQLKMFHFFFKCDEVKDNISSVLFPTGLLPSLNRRNVAALCSPPSMEFSTKPPTNFNGSSSLRGHQSSRCALPQPDTVLFWRCHSIIDRTRRQERKHLIQLLFLSFNIVFVLCLSPLPGEIFLVYLVYWLMHYFLLVLWQKVLSRWQNAGQKDYINLHLVFLAVPSRVLSSWIHTLHRLKAFHSNCFLPRGTILIWVNTRENGYPQIRFRSLPEVNANQPSIRCLPIGGHRLGVMKQTQAWLPKEIHEENNCWRSRWDY